MRGHDHADNEGADDGADDAADHAADHAADDAADDEEEDKEDGEEDGEEEDKEEEKDKFVDPLDGELALTPDLIPFFAHPLDKEPFDHDRKIYRSPVYIVNPKFSSKHCKPEDDQLFHNHYFAGYKQPKKISQFPIVAPEV